MREGRNTLKKERKKEKRHYYDNQFDFWTSDNFSAVTRKKPKKKRLSVKCCLTTRYHFTELGFSLLSPERAVNLSDYSKIKVYSFHYFALCRNWYAWPRHPEQLIFQQCVSAHTFYKAKEKEAKVCLHSCTFVRLKWTPAEDFHTWICFCAPMTNQEPYKNVQQYGKRLFNMHACLCL